MKKPSIESYCLNPNNFASFEQKEDFKSALSDVELHDDIGPLITFLRQHNRNVIADALDEAQLDGDATYKLEVHFYSNGDPYMANIDVKSQRNKESTMRYKDALLEFCQRLLHPKGKAEKRSDVKVDVIRSYGLNKPTLEKHIADYERKHGPLPRDPRGRKRATPKQ
jgi:hypothetical protein